MSSIFWVGSLGEIIRHFHILHSSLDLGSIPQLNPIKKMPRNYLLRAFFQHEGMSNSWIGRNF